MYIIVSKDKRIPNDVAMFDYETWTLQEFIEKASSDEGINVDPEGGIYYNIDSLSEDIYTNLKVYSEEGHINIVYYQFSDQNIALPFKVTEGIIKYETKPKEEVKKDIPREVKKPSVTKKENEIPIKKEEPKKQEIKKEEHKKEEKNISTAGFNVINSGDINTSSEMIIPNIDNILNHDDFDTIHKKSNSPAKVILFGSSKGGTGKTFTCLISAYRYAQTHPTEKVALADFDIIDGQVGITINKLTPTMYDYYKSYKRGNTSFEYLYNCKVKNDHFSPNIDFYLAPSMDIPQVTNDTDFWVNTFRQLITNYDVVFFDSGIDYLGKAPISQLYKIADRIIITCNPSINSVKSVIKQFKTVNGTRKNDVFTPELKILDRVRVVLTRVYKNDEINNIVVTNITRFAPVVAVFGNIDDIVSKIQWFQKWDLIDKSPAITKYLDKITDLSNV